jgi:hypothetical protein
MIICTKKDGTTITAQARAKSAVTWTLEVTQPDGSKQDIRGMAAGPDNNGVYTGTWLGVNYRDGTTYLVVAADGERIDDSQNVPFGTCS